MSLTSLAALNIFRFPPALFFAIFSSAATSLGKQDPPYPQPALRKLSPILESVPIIYDILKNLGINTIDKEGYEADDIIGTIALRAEKEGFQTFMVTPDKDFAQLVTKNIFLYKPARFGNGIEIWGVDEVNKKFEIDHPIKVIDYLGMMGDSVDNIPGLPGVGDKTAKKFLKEYGSLEGLIENIEHLKGKLKEKIEDNKELGFLSKKLATIIKPKLSNGKNKEDLAPKIIGY